MDIQEQYNRIATKVNHYKNDGKKIFVISSFQTHSIVLLHIISRIDRSIPVYFINTGFHFPETLRFKDQVVKLLDLNIREIRPFIPKHLQRNSSGNLYFTSDPDFCCYLNKVQPVEPLLREMDVWISGIRADQTVARNAMKEKEEAIHNTIKYHPMLNWSDKMVGDYIKKFDLPRHPLDGEGYQSIGCEPCTWKTNNGKTRDARWFGMSKTECGLHTDLIVKK